MGTSKVAELKWEFSARLVLRSGVGKSCCMLDPNTHTQDSQSKNSQLHRLKSYNLGKPVVPTVFVMRVIALKLAIGASAPSAS